MSPGFNGFDNRRSYWAYLFARLKPGVSIDQARTSRHGHLPRHHQRRRGAAPEGDERPDDGAVQDQGAWRRGRPARPEHACAARRAAAGAAARRDRPRAADRLREHREPAAGARGVARRRDGDAPVDRRQPLAAGGAAARRVVPARLLRRRRRPARRAVDARSDSCAAARRRGAVAAGRRSICR